MWCSFIVSCSWNYSYPRCTQKCPVRSDWKCRQDRCSSLFREWTEKLFCGRCHRTNAPRPPTPQYYIANNNYPNDKHRKVPPQGTGTGHQEDGPFMWPVQGGLHCKRVQGCRSVCLQLQRHIQIYTLLMWSSGPTNVLHRDKHVILWCSASYSVLG